MANAIEFDRVSKKFILPHEFKRQRAGSWLERLRRRGHWKEAFWALQDVSFKVSPGEAIGLMGPNGSGKSTILKLIVNILYPTHGRVSTHGRIAALLELGAGFHGDLSGRDNVYLNGSILGLGRKEMDKIFDDVVAFAEMERFIDAPVKFYSSGMYVRLGFSIATHVRPDILLIDETLSVGDQAFQAKCLQRIHDIKQQGVTIILVSHSLEAIRDLCDRGIWMDGGHLREDGPVNHVIASYLGEVIRKEQELVAQAASARSDRWGSGDIEITAVEFFNGSNQVAGEFKTGQPFTARIHYRAQRRVKDPLFGIAIYRADGVHINGPNTKFSDQLIESVEGEGMVEYCVPSLPLLDGNYLFSAAVYDKLGIHAYDHHHMRYQFSVVPGGVKERYGLLYIPSRWEHRREQ